MKRSAGGSLLFSLITIVLVYSPVMAAERVSLNSLFSDHAVLQRDLTVPVWGKAEPGARVVLQFAGQEKSAVADKDGKWLARLDPMPASSEGRTLMVKTDAEADSVSVTDILVGEVWVASGQSNMAWTLKASDGGEQAIASAGDGQLRLFNVTAKASDLPLESVGAAWVLDSPESAAGFSGVAYFFGRELRKSLGVPVGLIKSAVGGTVAEAWTPRGDLQANPTLKPLLDRQAARLAGYPDLLASWRQKEADLLRQYEEAAAKAKEEGKPAPRKPAPPTDPATDVNRPSGLYNGAIAPLVPYGIRGAIWYQGEANAGRATEYLTLFPSMIGAWRKAWGQGDFPFLFVQIAPYKDMTPEVREAQRLTVQTTQNTAMAVTVDIGNAEDIHPRAKLPVGERLALAARAVAYHQDVEFSGPEYDSITVSGNRAILAFKHIGGGLVARDGDLKGFAAAGSDGVFAPAKASIEGDTIVVTSDAVPSPAIVRYGWSHVPEVNLWNRAGLPASPFQTDRVFEMESGFETLFNGKDLSGWHYAGGPAFDGLLQASDSRYTARDGRIVVNPGKGLAQLWTMREFPSNFHLKLEFRAGVNADSGIFLRKPQLQCRDYLLAGPYRELQKYKPQDWNEIEVVVRDGTAVCTCNGEELKFPNPLPATGPIGLEADRGQMEYRRIRIKELP